MSERLSAMADLDDVSFDPYGFRPVGGVDGYRVGPATCGCGVTAQYASARFGFLCAPCFRTWKADRDFEALRAVTREQIADAYELPAGLRDAWDAAKAEGE
jgi:hypothetical protein